MELLKVLIDKFKVKELIGITWITVLIITILPNDVLEYLKIITIREKYQMYISLALIISSAYYIYKDIELCRKIIIKNNN